MDERPSKYQLPLAWQDLEKHQVVGFLLLCNYLLILIDLLKYSVNWSGFAIHELLVVEVGDLEYAVRFISLSGPLSFFLGLLRPQYRSLGPLLDVQARLSCGVELILDNVHDSDPLFRCSPRGPGFQSSLNHTLQCFSPIMG